MQYNTIQYNTIQYNTIQHETKKYNSTHKKQEQEQNQSTEYLTLSPLLHPNLQNTIQPHSYNSHKYYHTNIAILIVNDMCVNNVIFTASVSGYAFDVYQVADLFVIDENNMIEFDE